jgi:hypothetical protein
MGAIKLSVAQRRILSTGDIAGWFDVYGGYWWTVGPRQEPVRKVTIDVLVQKGCLIKPKYERVFSGRQRGSYVITKEARAALASYRHPTHVLTEERERHHDQPRTCLSGGGSKALARATARLLWSAENYQGRGR